MAYYNRAEQLERTLSTIAQSEVKDYELVIVDDASDTPLEGAIRVDPKDKWWTNPCIPFNMAFKEAKGDIIIIQNPECFHYGDVLSYVLNNVRDRVYISFACYAINEDQTKRLRKGLPEIYDRPFGVKERNGWYNNATHRPVGYHFCSAITKRDLDRIGGFDEEYALGVSYDDDDFVYRINNAGLDIKIVNTPFVVHQWHTPFTYKREGWQAKHEINKKLFEQKWL